MDERAIVVVERRNRDRLKKKNGEVSKMISLAPRSAWLQPLFSLSLSLISIRAMRGSQGKKWKQNKEIERTKRERERERERTAYLDFDEREQRESL